MRFKKYFVGKQQLNNQIFKYYVISKASVYGVGIEEDDLEETKCEYIYFTQDQEVACQVAHQMNKGFVTLTTMVEILDDMIA